MSISKKDWNNYIGILSKLCSKAGEELVKWIAENGLNDRNALIDYAYALVTKYGEGSSALACEMYDAIAELEHVLIPSAIPAATPTIAETAKAINGALKHSPSGQLVETVVQRLVKQTAADTTLKNAIRDRAQFAWIPSGDTCAFCLVLSSRGWQRASSSALKGGHAEHIHSHCDCQYAIRFSKFFNVADYNPDEYKELYDSFDGNSSAKINAIRRMQYEQNKDAINARKRANYAIRVENGDD